MKKIYTLALAALCGSISASAAFTHTSGDFVRVPDAAVTAIKPMSTSVSDVVGSYDWGYRSEFSGNTFVGKADIKLNDEGSLTLRLEDSEHNVVLQVKANWDSETSTLSIAKQFVGIWGDFPVYFSQLIVTENSIDVSEETIIGTYDATTQTINFDPEVVIAEYYVNSEAEVESDKYGWFAVSSEWKFTRKSDESSSWNDLGVAKFKDPIICAAFQVENAPDFDVQVFENAETPGLYKLVAPWALFDDNCNDLVIDLTDPDYGLIEYYDTGLGFDDEGNVWITSYSYAYATMAGVDKEVFLANLGAYNIYFDSSENKIVIPADCCFFSLPDSQDEELASLITVGGTTPGYVKLPTPAAIDGIAVDADENAPVEYYNLQGVKLANPEAGQVVIRRQGSKVSKIFVK